MILLRYFQSLLRNSKVKNLSKHKEEELWRIINKVGETIKSILILRGYDIVNVLPIGAVDIDPQYLAYWFATKSDDQRDVLLQINDEMNRLVQKYLKNEGYPEESIQYISCTFESQETVYRDYKGNWYYAMK